MTGLMQLAVSHQRLLVAGLSTRYLLPRVLHAEVRNAADTPVLGTLWNWLEDLPPALAAAGAAGDRRADVVERIDPFWQNDLASLTPYRRI